jgi:hypothetical protein
MKAALRNNLRGLKKEEDKDGAGSGEAPMSIGGESSFAQVQNPSQRRVSINALL